jgi:hypothetical protein
VSLADSVNAGQTLRQGEQAVATDVTPTGYKKDDAG